MKTYIITICLTISILLSGCSIFMPNKGKVSKTEEIGRAKIVSVETQQAINNVDKLETIAGLSYGTDYALSKIKEPPKEITVARDMNQRVMSLSGNPTIEKIKEMQKTIDKLTSTLATERNEGKERLNAKDIEISNLQNKAKELASQKEDEIHKYMTIAQEAAASADAYKAQLADYEGWFGLKAVGKGLWRFAKSSMWFLLGGGILFFILRIAAFSNPIAASIFSIFTTIGSWIVHTISVIIPKAVESAGHTTNTVFNVYKSTLKKIVDAVQIVKDRANKNGTAPNLNDVLNELKMNDDEQDVVDKIKKELNWS